MSHKANLQRRPTLRTSAIILMTSTRSSRLSRRPRPTIAEMTMIVHMNREVQIGEMLMDGKYIGRIRCE
eukprot:2198727-Heterocapsa_arctica.AAC.1